MKKDEQLFKKRNKQINLEYAMMDLQGLRHRTIVYQLSEKYFLKPRTIYAILAGYYEQRASKNKQ